MSTRPQGSGIKCIHATKRRWFAPEDDREIARLREEGATLADIARETGRSYSSIENRVTRLMRDGVIGKVGAPHITQRPAVQQPPSLFVPPSEQRSFKAHENGTAELTTTTHEPIRTLDDLIQVCEIDVQQWDVASWEARSYEMAAKDAAGVLQPRTLYRVAAKLKPRTVPLEELVTGLVDGVLSARTPAPPIRVPLLQTRQTIAQVVIIADPHFGKLAWSRGTGGADYDVDIAYRTLVEGAASLIRSSGRIEKRYIVSLGDFFHFDTLSGTTTGGTAVDRDSRVPKILEVGADALARIVRGSARSAETELITVPGNHDEVLSAALQRIMVAEFRTSPSVVVDDTHTRRKAVSYGRNLLGFNHGDKRKKELCAALAIEHPLQWGASTYREIHTGHLHSEGERYEGTITHAGVILRTHRSLTPPDQWHSDEAYVGAARGMSAWLYDRRGGLRGMHMYDPDRERSAA